MSDIERFVIDNIWKDLDSQLYQDKPIINTFKKCFCEDISLQQIIHLQCESVCENCGFVIEENRISDDAEWRCFNNENGFNDNGNRCGAQIDTLAPIHSMATIIAGNSRLAKRQLWNSLPYNERVLYQIKNELNVIVSLHNFPSFLTKSTLLLYKKFSNKEDLVKENVNSYRGNNKNAVVAVCFYYATKYHNLTINSELICNIFSIKNQKFSKYCKIYNEYVQYYDNSIYSVSDLCERYANTLNLAFNIQKLCKNIIKSCDLLDIVNYMSPQSIISGVIYFINCEMAIGLSKNVISSTCNVSINTITKTYKKISINKQKIFNKIKDFNN